ncbi:MAG: cobalt-precorrin-6A reductase [Maritimibacter sp.]
MKVLVLAGTSEARALIKELAADHEVIASLAGATRQPLPLGCPTRIGGFGGALEQENYIKNNGFDVVLDATHPFAARISMRTFEICSAAKIPYLQILRPGWQNGPGDQWIWIDKEQEAAAHIDENAVVFLATGRQTLQHFSNLSPRKTICRQIDPPEGDFPFENGEYCIGTPPFSVEDELHNFNKLHISHLVVKDAGGAPSRTKLDAARQLGIPVVLIRRPAQPNGPRVETVEAALRWIEARE